MKASSLGLVIAWLTACGTNIDLGGTTDAGPFAGSCDPCLTSAECQPNAVCARVGGDTFCVARCAPGVCATGEICASATTATAEHPMACLPASGACLPAAAPAGDGGACGALEPPSVVAACHSCGRFSDDCQPNGCYGGWWCDSVTRACKRPPTKCP